MKDTHNNSTGFKVDMSVKESAQTFNLQRETTGNCANFKTKNEKPLTNKNENNQVRKAS